MTMVKIKYNYINVMRHAGMPLEPVGNLQQLLNGIAEFDDVTAAIDERNIRDAATQRGVAFDIPFRFVPCKELTRSDLGRSMSRPFTIGIGGVLIEVLTVPAKPEVVVVSKPPARQYGRIHNMMQGDVRGPQTIVCKDAAGIREVCIFNAGGGGWSEKMEAELQTVLKALQHAA